MPGYFKMLFRPLLVKYDVYNQKIVFVFDDRRNVSEALPIAYDRFNDLVVGYEDYGSGFDRNKLEFTSALVLVKPLSEVG